MLTMALARELGPDVRVNAIAPGPVMWPEQGMTEALKRQIVANTALKRPGSPHDIAAWCSTWCATPPTSRARSSR